LAEKFNVHVIYIAGNYSVLASRTKAGNIRSMYRQQNNAVLSHDMKIPGRVLQVRHLASDVAYVADEFLIPHTSRFRIGRTTFWQSLTDSAILSPMMRVLSMQMTGWKKVGVEWLKAEANPTRGKGIMVQNSFVLCS
jgi:hypothetical protein